VIADIVRIETGLPVVEIEVPVICEPVLTSLRTRIRALVETAIARRKK